ncbi:MAG: hypothetical protein QG657_903 [Acidobacteriota bacterium]|nr:hypothetical protein [Acidobacteriota bacterium]
MNTLTSKSLFKIFFSKAKPLSIEDDGQSENFFYFFLEKSVDRAKKI